MDGARRLQQLIEILAMRPPGTRYRVWKLLADWPSGSTRLEAERALAEAAKTPGADGLLPWWSREAGGSPRLKSLLALVESEQADAQRAWVPDLLAAMLFWPHAAQSYVEPSSDQAALYRRLGDLLERLTNAELREQAEEDQRYRNYMESGASDRPRPPPHPSDQMRDYRGRVDWHAFCLACLQWEERAAAACELPTAVLCRRLLTQGDGGSALDLCDLELTELGPGLGELAQLERLKLRLPRLRALPEDLAELSSLRYLELENMSSLESLPAVFGSLTALESVKIWGGAFPGLPVELCALPSLKRLDFNNLNYGPPAVAPAALGQLQHLEELLLTDKSLQGLPAEIGRLSNLRKLSVHSSGFRTLPEEIGQLTQLEELEIIGSLNLEDLPASLGALRSLKRFSAMWWTRPHPPEGLRSLEQLEHVHFSADVEMDEAVIEAWRSERPQTTIVVSYSAPVMRKLRERPRS